MEGLRSSAENPRAEAQGWWGYSAVRRSPGINSCGLVLSIHAALGDRGPRWPGRIAAARTRMELPMYTMVVPMPQVERRTNQHYFFASSAQRTVPACSVPVCLGMTSFTTFQGDGLSFYGITRKRAHARRDHQYHDNQSQNIPLLFGISQQCRVNQTTYFFRQETQLSILI